MPRSIRIVAMIALLLVSSVAPVAGATTSAETATEMQVDDQAGNGTVNVSIGSQLATVIAVTSDDVQTTVGETMFEIEFTVRDDDLKAQIAAKRAAVLEARANTIRAEYELATVEFRAGEISRDEYARTLAVLNARAKNVVKSYERLDARTDGLSTFELRASGYDEAALSAAVEDLSSVRGSAANAILARFMGNGSGEIEIRSNNGVEIEAESEDGERSSEFERDRDDNDNITVSQSDALATARTVLSSPPAGNWTLERSSVHTLDGYYKFRFVLVNAPGIEGEAEVRVDGSTGDVFRAEQELERAHDDDHDEDREDDDREVDDDDEHHGELALVVERGTPEPGATIVVTVLADGAGAADVEVFVNGESVGTTDANGHLELTVPHAEDVKVEARHGDRDGSIEFEFDDDDHRDDALVADLGVDASLADDTVTMDVTFRGEPVRNATVYVDGERVGTTDADGTVQFALDGRTDFDVDLVKGDVGVELKYEVVAGTLHQISGPRVVDVDDDHADDEHEDETEHEEETEHDEETETEEEETEHDEETESDDDDTVSVEMTVESDDDSKDD